PPVDLELLARGVQRDRAGGQHRRCPAAAAAQKGVDARQHFLEVEGLDDVVVRPGRQAVHLVLPAITRGEHEHGKRLALPAQLADQVEAGQARQPEVDDGEVDRVLQREVQALAPVGGLLEGEAVLRELPAQRLAQRRVVFDHEEAHRKLPQPRSERPGTRTVFTLPSSVSTLMTCTSRLPLTCVSALTMRPRYWRRTRSTASERLGPSCCATK